MRKRISKNKINRLRTLKKKGFHIYQISAKLNISDRTVNKYTIDISHKDRRIPKEIPNKSKKFSKEKSEILGYLCSEGCEYNRILFYSSYDNRRNKKYPRKEKVSKVLFSNTNEVIQQRFIFLMKKVYNYNPKPDKRGNFSISRKRIIEDLHNYCNFGSRDWSVPYQLFDIKFREQAIYFIRAYCDGDATLEKKQRQVRIDSTNHNSLINLSRLLKKIGILNKCYRFKDRSRIIVKDVKTYLSLISFIHPKKLNNLKKLIAPRGGIS